MSERCINCGGYRDESIDPQGCVCEGDERASWQVERDDRLGRAMSGSILVRCMVEDALEREDAGAPAPELDHAWNNIDREVRYFERSHS